MDKIKIGRIEYEIKPGDYIQDNGSCVMLCSGDGRTLKREKWSSYNYVVLNKKNIKEIQFDTLRKVVVKLPGTTNELTRWFY